MNRWDSFFLKICETLASQSQCFSRKIGAIIVRDKTIISTGYNGPPRGYPKCNERTKIEPELHRKFSELNSLTLARNETCPRRLLGYVSGTGLDICPAAHAERNAIVNAAREGVCVKNAMMYMSCGIPCKDCMIEIVNAGISSLVVLNNDMYDKLAVPIAYNCGIKIRLFGERFLEGVNYGIIL